MRDTEAILAELAQALTGRAVRVHFGDPGRPDAAALVYRTRGGFAIVLRQGLPARDTFRAYCHELGHIMADARAFAVVDTAPRPSEVVVNPSLEARAEAVGAALMCLVPRECETVHDMALAVLRKLQRAATRPQNGPKSRARGP